MLHPRHIGILLGLTVCLCASTASPQERFEGSEPPLGQWLSMRSTNFEVVGDASEIDIRLAASELELFRDQFSRLFSGARKPSSVPTRIVVFRTKQLRDSLRPPKTEVEEGSGGYVHSGVDRDYIVLAGGEALSRSLLFEYIQLLTRDSVAPVPFWFQAGVSEYFSTYRLSRMGRNRLITFGLDGYYGMHEGKLIPFAELSSINKAAYAEMDAANQHAFRAQSCAVFYYLLQTRRLGMMMRYFNALADGARVDATFKQIFGIPLATFDAGLKRQLHVLNWKGWFGTFVAFSADDKTRELSFWYAGEGAPRLLKVNRDTVRLDVEGRPVRHLSEGEGRLQIGELLLHNGRLQEAEPYLVSVLKGEPDLFETHSALAVLRTLQHQYAEARHFIEEALALNPENFLAQYRLGWLIHAQAREAGTFADADMESARLALAKSAELSPDFVPAAALLAETHRLQRSDVGLQGKLLLDAIKRSPGRVDLLLAAGRIAADESEDFLARWMLRRVVASGADRSTEREARELLAQLRPSASEKLDVGGIDVDESSDSLGVDSLMAPTDKKKESKKSEEKIVRAGISKVDCSKGLTIYIVLGMPPHTENLHTDNPGSVTWITDGGDVLDAIQCGVGAGAAAITYRPKRKGLTMGEPVHVELCTNGSTDCQ